MSSYRNFVTMFVGASQNGNSEEFPLDSRRFTLFLAGTFGGAAVRLQGSPNGIHWVDLMKPDGSGPMEFTQPGAYVLEMDAAAVRGKMTGATGTTSVHGAYLTTNN